MKHGKKYLAALEKVEPGKKHTLDEAVAKLKEIAKKKMVDLNTSNLEAAMKTIEGTAKSMGLTVEG